MNELQLYDKEKTNMLNEMESEGRRIYRTNEHYQRLANVMENPDFREFYDKYFQDPQMMQVILSFMKTYEEIEKISVSSKKLTPYQKLSVLKRIFDKGITRKAALQGNLKMLKHTDL